MEICNGFMNSVVTDFYCLYNGIVVDQRLYCNYCDARNLSMSSKAKQNVGAGDAFLDTRQTSCTGCRHNMRPAPVTLVQGLFAPWYFRSSERKFPLGTLALSLPGTKDVDVDVEEIRAQTNNCLYARS